MAWHGVDDDEWYAKSRSRFHDDAARLFNLFMGALILSIFRPRGEELRPFLSRGDDDGTIRSRVANGRQAFRDQRGVPIRSDTMLIPAINQSL